MCTSPTAFSCLQEARHSLWPVCRPQGFCQQGCPHLDMPNHCTLVISTAPVILLSYHQLIGAVRLQHPTLMMAAACSTRLAASCAAKGLHLKTSPRQSAGLCHNCRSDPDNRDQSGNGLLKCVKLQPLAAHGFARAQLQPLSGQTPYLSNAKLYSLALQLCNARHLLWVKAGGKHDAAVPGAHSCVAQHIWVVRRDGRHCTLQWA